MNLILAIPFFALSWSFVGELWMSALATGVFLLVSLSAKSTKNLRKKIDELNAIGNNSFKQTSKGELMLKINLFKIILISAIVFIAFAALKFFTKFELYDLVVLIETCLRQPHVKLSLLFSLAMWLGNMVKEAASGNAKSKGQVLLKPVQ